MQILRARQEDHIELTQISIRAKNYWGYPKEWLNLWNDDLLITTEFISLNLVYKIVDTEKIIGFCSIEIDQEALEIAHMWILPEYMGKGLGKTLLTHVLNKHLGPELEILKVISDPNAVGFYKKFGFQITEMVDSKPGNRQLPLLSVKKNQLIL